MDTTSPAFQVKLSLTLIIILSIGVGLDAAWAFDGWLRGDSIYAYGPKAVMALLFLVVALLHTRKVCGLVR